jgi:hypothetical protein
MLKQNQDFRYQSRDAALHRKAGNFGQVRYERGIVDSLESFTT